MAAALRSRLDQNTWGCVRSCTCVTAALLERRRKEVQGQRVVRVEEETEPLLSTRVQAKSGKGASQNTSLTNSKVELLSVLRKCADRQKIAAKSGER